MQWSYLKEKVNESLFLILFNQQKQIKKYSNWKWLENTAFGDFQLKKEQEKIQTKLERFRKKKN